MFLRGEHEATRRAKAKDGERDGDVVSALENDVRVFSSRGRLADGHDTARADDAIHGVNDEREHDEPRGVFDAGALRHRRAENHGGDDLGGDGFEEIGTASRTIADVIAD